MSPRKFSQTSHQRARDVNKASRIQFDTVNWKQFYGVEFTLEEIKGVFDSLSKIVDPNRQSEKRSEYQTLVLKDGPFGIASAVSFFRRPLFSLQYLKVML